MKLLFNKRGKRIATKIVFSSNELTISRKSEYQKEVQRLTAAYRWMSLAGGINQVIEPIITFKGDCTVVLMKKGYDLATDNLKTYYTSLDSKQAYRALDKFAKDLLGDNTDKMTVSAEYIADYLIKLDDERDGVADFTIAYETTISITLRTDEEKALFSNAVKSAFMVAVSI